MKGFHISCIITGEEKYLTNSVLQNKLRKFGTQEVLEKYYVSKPAAKLLKQGLGVDEVRQKLKSTLTKSVDYEVLYKLRLLKKKRGKTDTMTPEQRKKQEEESVINHREYYNRIELLKTDLKAYVEWATGGPNKCQVERGGTCIRPDIYYDNEHNREGRCKTCPYHAYCLCANKEVRN